MKKVSIERPKILNTDDVIFTSMGDIMEVKYLSCKNSSPTIKKLDSDHYMVLATGEIKEVNKSIDRGYNLHSFAQSFRDLRELINANYHRNEQDRLLWLTLTFADNERDPKVFAHCFDIFWKRMKRYFERNQIPIPKYITTVEPQGRGAWHGHMLLFFPCSAPFIPNNEVLEKYWEWGFTRVERLDGVKNVGAYLTAYLTDMPLDEIEDLSVSTKFIHDSDIVQGKSVDKRFVKGARLHLYPVGMKLYRASQGLDRPSKTVCSFDEACTTLELLNAEKCYEHHIRLEDENSDFSSIVSVVQYYV